MKLIHLICKSPKHLKGEYYFDYYGDFIDFLYRLDMKADVRKRYLAQLQKEGIVSAYTGRYSFSATMDLEQFAVRYKPREVLH